MLHATTAELRDNMDLFISRVNAENEPLIISSENRVLAVMMPVTNPAYLEEMEDRMDIAAADRAMEEEGEDITLEEFERRLNAQHGI
jgi:PHD/YefM family antitoxin component YafN of YafNO toxin-antitoxin module